jgi:hypothetical protein
VYPVGSLRTRGDCGTGESADPRRAVPFTAAAGLGDVHETFALLRYRWREGSNRCGCRCSGWGPSQRDETRHRQRYCPAKPCCDTVTAARLGRYRRRGWASPAPRGQRGSVLAAAVARVTPPARRPSAGGHFQAEFCEWAGRRQGLPFCTLHAVEDRGCPFRRGSAGERVESATVKFSSCVVVVVKS